jgi:endopeptidase La
MSEIKDFKINNLIDEYHKFSSYFRSFQNHIERCYNDHIITIKDRNNFLKLINDLIRQLNTTYNIAMIEITENDNNDDKEFYGKNISELRNLIHIHKVIGINKSTDQFHDLSNELLNKFGTKIGFPSINIALSIIIGDQYKYMFDQETNNMLKFYDNVFIPLKYSIEKINNTNKILIKKMEINQFVLIQNCANIYIKHNDSYIVLSGYFECDPLNITIRTSQLCNNFIYQKKKELENFIQNKKGINDKFLRSYMRNIILCDLIALSNDEFYASVLDDYRSYNKLIKLSFIHLMKEFIKDENDNKLCFKNMFNIIRLLLIGSDDSINIAGLLYGITKEKKIDNEFSISDIIYKNLSYLSQIKLRKTTINIKSAIDKIKSMSIDDIDLKKQVIACKNMSDIVKKATFEKIEEMKTSNNEYYKQLLYVRTLLNYPWPSPEDDTFFADIGKSKDGSKIFLDNVIKSLNDKVYGHIECKESIKELIGKWLCNPSSSGSAIGLSGPPGVGKTLIAKAIGESLGIPFVQITLGGQNDGELLHGHGYTYSGAQPGMIVKKMVEAGNARCVMYFDELDKATKKFDSNEIYNILIHITDPNTNTEFQDRFFQEIKFPLNKVLFIFSYNDSELIDNILMDRIKEIDVKPFKTGDKKIIVDKFLIKEMCDLVGFEEGSIIIEDNTTDFIINQYTNESGVRDLKRKLEKIFLKLNIDKIYGTNIFEKISIVDKSNPLILSKDIVEKYLGKNTIHIQCIHSESIVGVINGLYATDSGQGGILPIQIFDNYTNDDGKFTLKLTGSQKRVMRESVISAFTCAMHCIKEDIRNDYFARRPNGLHIHAISTSTPKNGPSGGCAFACAFISRILNKKIRNDIAMTGEIELTGKIAKIGGLQYKLIGAKRAGVKIVFVPEDNKEDVEQIQKDNKELIDDNFKIIIVNNLREILKHILIDFDPNQIN